MSDASAEDWGNMLNGASGLFVLGASLKYELSLERGATTNVYPLYIGLILGTYLLLSMPYVKNNRKKVRTKVSMELRWVWLQLWLPYSPWFR